MKYFALLFLFSSQVFALTCEESNLFLTNQKLLEMKIQNQGSFSTCYAHTLAAAYEERTNFSYHPYSIAFTHKNRSLHWKPYDLDYSFSKFAWSDILKKGACSYSEIHSKLEDNFKIADYNDDQIFYALKIFFEYKDFHEAFNFLKEEPFKEGKEWLEDDLLSIFHQVKDHLSLSFFDYMSEYIFNDCKTYTPKLKLKTKGLGFSSNKKLIDFMEKSLQKNTPPILGYCSEYQDENGTPLSRPTKPRIFMPLRSSCGAHYVLIAGQRYNRSNNACEVLIRNSHGTNFWGDKDCYCQDIKTKKQRVCTKADKLDSEIVLGCYYEREEFFNQTFEVSTLEN